MRKILVVEDNEQLRAMLKQILVDSGYAVLEAATGAEVSVIYELHHPELVIANLLMPDKDGLEVIRDLHRLDRSARIIAISGGSQKNAETYLRLARKFGARSTLTKPFTPEEFLDAVNLELASET